METTLFGMHSLSEWISMKGFIITGLTMILAPISIPSGVGIVLLCCVAFGVGCVGFLLAMLGIYGGVDFVVYLSSTMMMGFDFAGEYFLLGCYLTVVGTIGAAGLLNT